MTCYWHVLARMLTPGETHLVDSPSVGSGYEAASVRGEANPGESLDAGGGDGGLTAHHRQVVRFSFPSWVFQLVESDVC